MYVLFVCNDGEKLMLYYHKNIWSWTFCWLELTAFKERAERFKTNSWIWQLELLDMNIATINSVAVR